MTRRGSLAYYLAAWVCGCFFMGATIWLANELRPAQSAGVSFFLYIYFLSLMFGALTALLFAFFLRRAANGMHWNSTWQWLVGGAILAPVLTALLGWTASLHLLQGSIWRMWICGPLIGPYVAGLDPRLSPLFAAPAGAATAWVLSRVHRAFSLPSGNTVA